MSQNPDLVRANISSPQDAARVSLGLMLAFAGASHLTFARKAFQAQVPSWVPFDPDTIVVQSGVVEIALGSALMLCPRKMRMTGSIAAVFFAAVFPGNLAQYKHRRNAFGLDTDGKRFARLFFQPLLVAWALWSIGALGSKHGRGRNLTSGAQNKGWA